MRARATGQVFAALLLYAVPALAGPASVRLEDPRFEITLFAEQPQIWTPTGIAVDPQGRVLAIESNTHLPKPDYSGPKTDRIKIFTDKDNDGRADEVAVFAEGFRWAMNMAYVGADLYVIQRDAVIVLHDGRPDAREQILTLETKGDFPHNGLGGFCASLDGSSLYIGFGENLGLPYTLKGKDGSAVSGGGEGGNIFKCDRDGTKVERFATGFWNPFALTFDNLGNLFAVDNDPDGRPPCRLLHVIQGGNYGYQFRYGRSGLHPFVAWDGELPGTLGMVAGTGEAPSGLLYCPRIGWPAEYANSLVGTSWGDNLLETFPLQPRGASFKAERKVLARGDQSFRPVAMAVGQDGAVYITDWADVAYPVHQKGRIWRLTQHAPRNKPTLQNANTQILNEIAQIPQRSKSASEAADELLKHAGSDDPFVRSAAVTQLATLHRETLFAKRTSKNPRERLAVLLALREKGDDSTLRLIKRALQDPDEDIRRIAIIWATEQHQTELQNELPPAALKEPTSLALIQTYLAARQIFSGYEKKSVWEQGSTGADLVEALLKDDSQPSEL
ncbi:MAG TPA: PVC-type heme-binding CxxCH protein, partial [Verrucomicrobiae bacterium]